MSDSVTPEDVAVVLAETGYGAPLLVEDLDGQSALRGIGIDDQRTAFQDQRLGR